MTIRQLLLATLLAGLFAPALAQDAHPSRASDGALTFHFNSLDHDARTGVTAARGVALKNVPYSAQGVTERTQVLGDGNQIVNRRMSMTYRDSAGRTRQEFRDAKGDVVTVTIKDPAAGTTVILDPRKRTAVRIGAAAQAERMAREGGDNIIVKRVEGLDDAERQRIQQDVRIQVSNALTSSGSAVRDVQMQLAPLVNGAFADLKWSSQAVTKELGTRDFNGIKAEGKLRSYEIPAGAIGNRNAIVVTDETWTAPDLMVTVYTKHSDPRSGDVVFRLENLKREEPAAALFAVPADYTVRDAGSRWRDKTDRADK
jgi:hypothetical protein